MLIGFPNRIDEATLSGGSWAPTLPLGNLQRRLFSQVARSTDTDPESTQFLIDLGRPRKLRILSLLAHTISLRGQIRYEAFADEALTLSVYDSGLKNVWGSVLGANWDITQLEWRSSNWYLGTFNSEEIEGFTSATTEVLRQEVSARFWRVSIDDPRNPAGSIDIGRVFFGEAWQPRRNRTHGGGIGYEMSTKVTRAIGGAKFFDKREPLRVIRFTLPHMAAGEAYGKAMQLIRRANLSEEVFVIPNPSAASLGLYQNFMGTIRQPSALEEAMWIDGGTGHNMAFEIEELR